MSFKRDLLFQAILAITLPITTFTSPPDPLPPPLSSEKGEREDFSIHSVSSYSISNEYLRAIASGDGRFVIGTTGGEPGVSDDDNKRLLYGFPSSIWSTFSTLRVGSNNYSLGRVDQPISVSVVGNALLAVWELEGVRVEQRLYFALNRDTNRLDVTHIEYTLKNNASSIRSVGLRILLDVMIGSNDGAPYFIQGVGQVTRQREWFGESVPDYWVAYESTTFSPDSLRARGQLKGDNLTPPDRFVIADWPQAYGGDAWNYTVNPDDLVTNDSAVLLYYSPTLLAPGQSRVIRTQYGIAAREAQLELIGLEVTQGIQNWRGDAELVEGRPTFVRAHIRSTSGLIPGVRAELIGRRGGSTLPLSPLQPSNRGGSIVALENPNRLYLNDSLYYELPPSWLSGTVELELRAVDRQIACRERAGLPNDCKVQVSFVESPELEVRFVGVIWRENSPTGEVVEHRPSRQDIESAAQEIFSTFPVARLRWDHTYDIGPVFQPTTGWHFTRLNLMLSIKRLLDGCVSIWPVNCRRYYLGIVVNPPVPVPEGGLTLGMASGILGDVATAYLRYPNHDYAVVSHEMGHLVGRRHVECTPSKDDEAGADPSYPYPGGRISQDLVGDRAFYGFDINTRRIYGSDTGDLMSYCSPNWPSDWTFRHVRQHLLSRYATVYGAASLELLTGQPAVLVSGFVTPTEGTGRLESVYFIESPASASVHRVGSYLIRFEDANGQELASYRFEPDFGIASCIGCSASAQGSVGTFSLLLPRPEGTSRLVLMHNDQPLDARTASNNPPALELIYPNGGESLDGSTATVSWLATDADGDSLEFVVQYSPDGGSTWQTLVSNWTSTTLELDLDSIAGTDRGLLRITASDGFHTVSDQSEGFFSVARRPPQVSILAPVSGSLYVANQNLFLEASAYDKEDGQLGEASLAWYSSLNGFLGTGHYLVVNASQLNEGSHTITLVARDSDGETGTARVEVTVHRSRPTLPAALAVAPGSIRFSALRGLPTAYYVPLSIRNEGDGTLQWSASVSHDWIRLSASAGNAPADILVSVDTVQLPAGEHAGYITIVAQGAVNSSQQVMVRVQVREPKRVYIPISRR